MSTQVDEEIPDDTEDKTAEDDTDVSHDSLIKMPKKRGAGAKGAATAKGKAKAKK